MNQNRLNDIIRSFPQTPGVYLFNDNKNNALYVGKASRLKDRLLSYLKTTDIRLKKMLEQSHSLKRQTADSEIEALILESQLIKKLKPKYNIALRDDKQYFYVYFTEEKLPKIFIIHRPAENQNNCFGPFTDGTALKTALRFLRNIFPYCTCRQKHNLPCLNYHIGKCPGFCCLKDSPGRNEIHTEIKSYQNNIKAIKNILSGKKMPLIKKLKSEMIKCGEKEQFDEAIELRNKIKKLEKIFQNAQIISKQQSAINNSNQVKKDTIILKALAKILKLKIPLTRIEGYDISNIQGANAVGSMIVFRNGQPDQNEYRKFKIRSKNTPDDTAMLSEIIRRRFKHPEWQFPDLILVDGGKGQLNAIRQALPEKIKNIPAIGIAKGKMEIFNSILDSPVAINRLPVPVQNLIKHIDSEAHRFAIGYYRKLHRKSSLII